MGVSKALTWGVGAAVVMCASLAAQRASACTCSERAADLDEETARRGAIFYGAVTAFDELGPELWAATFKIDKSYKGKFKEGSVVTVMTGATPKQCGVDFRIGRKYIVYADEQGGGLTTSTCSYTEKLADPPLAPEVRSLAPVPTGKGSVESRTRRAEDVVVVKITEAGRSFAGSWDAVIFEAKVTTSFKGTRAGKTLKIMYDQDACSGGKRRNLLAEDDMFGEAAPFEEGKSYLLYTFDDEPTRVMPCHRNFEPLGDASAQIRELEVLCAGGACNKMGRGHKAVTKLRNGLRGAVASRAKSTIKTCAKKLPMYSKSGAITEVSLDVQLRADGKVALLGLSTSGTIASQTIYDKVSDCIAGAVSKWSVPEFPGEPVVVAMKLQIADAKRGPKFERVKATLSTKKRR